MSQFSIQALNCFDRGPVACGLRQTLVLISMFKWLQGSHSLFAPRGIIPVVLYSCIVKYSCKVG